MQLQVTTNPTDGAYFIRELFTQPLNSSIYIVWLVALCIILHTVSGAPCRHWD
jgi:hypothetical protein